MDESSTSTPRPTLPDPWDWRGEILLDGPVESVTATPSKRQARAILAGTLGLIFSFLLFQLVISPIFTIALLLSKGVSMADFSTPDAFTRLVEENVRELIMGNSAGQILGLALPALLLARLHSRQIARLLRIRRVDWGLLGLAVLGLVLFTPIVQWLGTVNQSLPLPDWLEAMEQTQMQLIEKVLGGGLGVTFNIAMLAVVPAICEEVLFRGYAQRQFERGLGAWGGIVASGVLFGIYHLRFTQVLPLTALGLYLAYLVWRTGSIWPAVVVHFANNAFSVLLANYFAAQPDMNTEMLETMQIPWYIVGAGALLFVGLMAVLHQRARALKPHASA